MKRLILKRLSLVPNEEMRQILGGDYVVTPEPPPDPYPTLEPPPDPDPDTDPDTGCRKCYKNNHCQKNS